MQRFPLVLMRLLAFVGCLGRGVYAAADQLGQLSHWPLYAPGLLSWAFARSTDTFAVEVPE